jgi:Osmosensitive K+ channel histidine kinase
MLRASTIPPTLRMVVKSQPAQNGRFQLDRWSLRRRDAADRMHNEEWLATLSHELRSPLAAILDALDLVFSQLHESRAQRAGEIAQRQARKAIQIIEDLFDLNAHSCGKLVLRKELVQVDDVVARAAETANHLITAGRHSLTVLLPPKPVFVLADPLRLEQVLTNLLINAAKFTQPGGHILLTATEQFGEIVLSVQDNGRGIASELLPRVFDLHKQSPDVGGRRPAGLGLGLALVKTIIELHGGSVAATSGGPGTGSEFVVRLPMQACAA